MCRMFTISNLNEIEREGALKGRLKYITATVKYNESDWSYGWSQHIDGLTLYISVGWSLYRMLVFNILFLIEHI